MRYLIVLLLFTSCYSARKATEQTNKALVRYPAVVAKVARTAFPCIPVITDSSGYKEALAERDTLAYQADSLSRALAGLSGFIQGLRADSVAAANCGELLQQVEDHITGLEKENAALGRKIREQKPSIIRIVTEDSAKIFEAMQREAIQVQEAAKWRALYEKEKTDHDKLKAKSKGKLAIYIPIWLVILAGMGVGYAVLSVVKQTANPLNWIKKAG